MHLAATKDIPRLSYQLMEAQIQLNGCAAEGFGRGKAPQDRITEGSQKPQQQIGGSQQVRGCPKHKFTVSQTVSHV